MVSAGFPVPLRRNRSFVLLWSGQSVSLLGSQVTLVALPLVAVLTLDASAWEMGLLAASGRAPYLVFGLPAGVWLDRLSPRRVLVVSALGQAVTLAVVPAAAALDVLSLPLLLVVAFVTGGLALFADIAALVLVPIVVPRRQLTSGQGALEASYSVAQVGGPALAGWLVQVLTAPLALLADTLSFLITAGAIGSIRTPPRPAGHSGGPGMARQIAAGARAVFGQRILRSVTLCTTTHMFFFHAFNAVLVLFLVRDLGLAPAVLGVTLAVGALGGFVGSAAAHRIGRRLGLGRAMAAANAVAGVAAAFVAVADAVPGGTVAIVAGALVVMSCAQAVYHVHQVPVRYALAPQAMQGRVNATIRTTVWSTAGLGALVGGLLGDLAGLPATLVVSGLGATLASLWLILSRVTAVSTLDTWSHAVEDGGDVGPGRERAERHAPVAGEPGGAERVGDGRGTVPDQ